MTGTTTPIFLIECRTGCTCCQSENFVRGPYTDKALAEATIAEYRQGKGNPLASQYARYGHYRLIETEAEVLPDGRAIIFDSVYENLDFQDQLYDTN